MGDGRAPVSCSMLSITAAPSCTRRSCGDTPFYRTGWLPSGGLPESIALEIPMFSYLFDGRRNVTYLELPGATLKFAMRCAQLLTGPHGPPISSIYVPEGRLSQRWAPARALPAISGRTHCCSPCGFVSSRLRTGAPRFSAASIILPQRRWAMDFSLRAVAACDDPAHARVWLRLARTSTGT